MEWRPSSTSDGKLKKKFSVHEYRIVPICQHDHVVSAVAAADSYALRRSVPHLIEHRANWRKDPATEQQVHLLRRMKVGVKDSITKGAAAALIAITQWRTQMQKVKAKKAKEGKKGKKRKQRNRVEDAKVGGEF